MLAAGLVPVAVARALAPPAVTVLPVRPGRTLGGVLVAEYGEGSTLRYSELIVFSGLAWHRGRVGLCVSHIVVDDSTSLTGGRELWGLPKELAEFRWRDGHRAVEVHGREGSLLRMRAEPAAGGAAARGLTLRTPAPFFGVGPVGTTRWTPGHGVLGVVLAIVRLDLPPGSPLAALGLVPFRRGLWGRADLTVPAPRLR